MFLWSRACIVRTCKQRFYRIRFGEAEERCNVAVGRQPRGPIWPHAPSAVSTPAPRGALPSAAAAPPPAARAGAHLLQHAPLLALLHALDRIVLDRLLLAALVYDRVLALPYLFVYAARVHRREAAQTPVFGARGRARSAQRANNSAARRAGAGRGLPGNDGSSCPLSQSTCFPVSSSGGNALVLIHLSCRSSAASAALLQPSVVMEISSNHTAARNTPAARYRRRAKVLRASSSCTDTSD